MSDWYTPRVAKRTELARALKAKGATFLRAAHLTEADLDAIITSGEAAREADREQQVQRAEHEASRAARSESAKAVEAREADLAAVLPAVVLHLHEAGQAQEATFLAKLSFARYRFRALDVPVDTGDGESEVVRAVKRVEKGDIASRASGLAALCATLRGRSDIVAALDARGFGSAELAELEREATTVAANGSNPRKSVEATEREHAAVRAQKAKWSAIRQLVRRACKDDPQLLVLLAEA